MGILDRAAQVASSTPRDAKATGAKGVRTLTPREEEAVWRVEMLSELRRLANTSTSAAARDSSQIVNDVLDVQTFRFGAGLSRTFDYHVAVGSVMVANLSATEDIVVASGTSSGDTVPSTGRGVQVVPAGSWLAVPIGARAFTLWGASGERVSLQVFAGMQAFGVSR